MDVFDYSQSYQRALMRLAPTCPLLFHSICALAAQQLRLITMQPRWDTIAESHYGKSLGILMEMLNDHSLNPEHAFVGSILLSSYELLAFLGHDYQQHFKGAKSLAETIGAHKSSSQLSKASFWIYVRHDVNASLFSEHPPLLQTTTWPRLDPSVDYDQGKEDDLCNDMLRICSETLCLVFGSTATERGKKWAKDWSALMSDLDEWYGQRTDLFKGIQCSETTPEQSVRYWFPLPVSCKYTGMFAEFSPNHSDIFNQAGAMHLYHVSKLLLWLRKPEQVEHSGEVSVQSPT